MLEAILAILGLVGGFLVAVGWFKRGVEDMNKEIDGMKTRLSAVEGSYQNTYTDLEVIKQRIYYMESKIDEIHKVIMRPVTLGRE